MSNKFGDKKIPSSPGIYFFKDRGGRVLYVGKASNLKKRLASYKKVIDPRIAKMVETASDLDWQETGSEIEALILESRLIKKHHPPFNIMLRDDKQYFFVRITKEDFPRIFITHQPNKVSGNLSFLHRTPRRRHRFQFIGSADWNLRRETAKERLPLTFRHTKSTFVGPFTEGASLKSTLKLLRKIFPFCTCKQKHNRYCLNYHIGNCLSFCCLRNPQFTDEQKADYKKNIKAIGDVLNGKRISIFKKLEKEMNTEGEKENFKKAIELRNKLAQLQQVFENAKVIKESAGKEKTLLELQKILNLPSIPQRIEGYDVSNIQGQFATGAMVVFTDGQPDKNEYRKFKIRNVLPNKGGDVAMLKEMLSRRFNHPEWPFPDLILVDGGKAQLNAVLATMGVAPHREIVPMVIALTKDEKHKGHHIFSGKEKTAIALSDLSDPVRNLILHIDAEAHRFAISYYRKLHRQII